MLPRSEREIFGAAEREKRFDADSVRRILGRAVAEQHRLDNERADGYSLQELEEIAAEAGISREALRAAIERPRGSLGKLLAWMPDNWSPAAKGIVLMSIAGLVLFGVSLAFPAVAQVLVLVMVVLAVLVLLGASPF